jgi:PAS domain S-box-containing protein
MNRQDYFTQENSLMKDIIDKSPYKVIITDKSGKIIYLNKKAENISGMALDQQFSPDEMTFSSGKKVSGFEELRLMLEKWNAETFKSSSGSGVEGSSNDDTFSFESWFKQENKENYPVKITAKLLRSSKIPSGCQECICFYAEDISGRKKTEESLLKSEKDKTTILNAIHENLVYYNTDFEIIWANQDPADSLGMKPEGLTGKVCYRLWYNRDSPCENCTVKKAIESKEPVIEEKLNYNKTDVKVLAYPVFDDNGEVIGAVESSLNITKRKNAEKALQISEMEYKELFSTMTNGFVLHELITDNNGEPADYRFLKVNKAFENMTGLSAEQIKGRTMLEVFPDSGKYLIKRYGRVAMTGIPDEFNNYNPYLNRHYHVYSYCPKIGHFAAIFTEITELMELKKQQKNSLEQIEKNLEDLAILNDEIRNPLQAIIGYVTLEEREYTDRILSQAKVIDRLVNRLDKGWLESEKIRDFLRKHYSFS